MFNSLAEQLDASSYAEYMSESLWAFPVMETVHVAALILVISSIIPVDLRIAGWSSSSRSVRELSTKMLPLVWSGFAAAFITGVMMLATKASSYLENTAFMLKMSLLLAAGLNMLMLHFLTYRSASSRDVQHGPPPAARIAGVLSLLLCMSAVFAGRWIEFIR